MGRQCDFKQVAPAPNSFQMICDQIAYTCVYIGDG
jgi:hypothetical protein